MQNNTDEGKIEIFGAREHNLKNFNLEIPRKKLVVFTGLSGSGKSSLAFDTIYAEGKRRYIETFSSYARTFLGNLERPNIDEITGLNPVISIEQKATNKNPRSTVGTITEIYDYLRLLYARVGIAYSYKTGEKMIKYTEKQIIDLILKFYNSKPIFMLAPVVRTRKGHYRELFESLVKKGYLTVRVDGEFRELYAGMKVDRYKTHNIEVVIDKLRVSQEDTKRLKESLEVAMILGKGIVMLLEKGENEPRYFSKNLMCPTTGLSYRDPAPNMFSFNSPEGMCPSCKGLGKVSIVDVDKIIPDRSLSIYEGGILILGKYKNSNVFNLIKACLNNYDCTLKTPIKKLPEEALNDVLYGCKEKLKITNEVLGNSTSFENFDGVVKLVNDNMDEFTPIKLKRWMEQFISYKDCPDCKGTKLNIEARHYRIEEKNIAELSNMDISELYSWMNNIEPKLSKKQLFIATEILKEIRTRLKFLLDVGLDYLSLDRSAASLSGGESQRIRLATQIGSQLVNVMYILDEPSIGLHQRDNDKLIDSLKKLRDNDNSVIVVEHDKDMMLESDYIVDIGPAAGRNGGEVVFSGTPTEMLKTHTLTAQYLNGEKKIELPKERRKGNGKYIKLFGCSGNNLKNVDVEFPLGKLTLVTGVSGSGKSTLINETLQPLLSAHFYNSLKKPKPYSSVQGLDNIDKVISVDQSPLGKSSRSNPATYTGVFSYIRDLYVSLSESKIRGYKPGRFSFNVKGGRCEVCKGYGYKTIEMNFLPDVFVPCEACGGKRYNRETLEVRFKGKSIADVLDMTINNAVDFFENQPRILRKIKILQSVGLGYIKLGQPSTTLSGGENQRIKLATELAKKDTGKTLYILDEPTTGLHFEDIKVFLGVINRIMLKGNTVVIIEHNLDVIKVADHIIDLGPEGGKKGGEILFTGTPEEMVKKCPNNFTAKYLKSYLK